jgi:putative phosphoribosyl transferase
MRTRRDVRIPAGRTLLWGELCLPPSPAAGIIVFAHGSGVTRRDPLHRFVARRLERARFATLLMDLLEEHENRDRHNVFDVEMQAQRLIEVKDWLGLQPGTRSLSLGYFGTGIGTGVVLAAAAKAPQRVSAIVSSGGRPDKALAWVPRVKAATLFIDDDPRAVPDFIAAAYRAATAEKELVCVPGPADAVARLACRWFARHLPRARAEPACRDADVSRSPSEHR